MANGRRKARKAPVTVNSLLLGSTVGELADGLPGDVDMSRLVILHVSPEGMVALSTRLSRVELIGSLYATLSALEGL